MYLDNIEQEREKPKYCECGKRCYTERDAGFAINSMQKNRKSKWCKNTTYFKHGEKIPKRKYYCNLCGYYHLTSQKTHLSNPKDAKSLKKKLNLF